MNIIETHDLCKQYGNALRVAHLDLDVPEGSVYGFLGPNGAGKSTTLKMILGLVRPTAGDIRVLGKKMDGGSRLAVLRQVGSLIESPSYYGHLTGEENLRIVQTLRGPAGLSQAADPGRAHQRPGPGGHPGDAGADLLPARAVRHDGGGIQPPAQ